MEVISNVDAQRSAVRSIAWLDAFIAAQRPPNRAHHLATAQSKDSALSPEFRTSENSIDDVIGIAHVSTEVDLQGSALYLINRWPGGDMALDYDELPPNVLPAAETTNTGLVRHSKRKNLGLWLAGSWLGDKTPDGASVPFARRGL